MGKAGKRMKNSFNTETFDTDILEINSSPDPYEHYSSTGAHCTLPADFFSFALHLKSSNEDRHDRRPSLVIVKS